MFRNASLGLLALFLFTPLLQAQPRQGVSFKAEDELELHADLWRGELDGPVAILLHSYRSDRRGWRGLAPRLHEAGYTVLALDQRAHGESTRGKSGRIEVDKIERSEFGEHLRAGREDVGAALRYLRRRRFLARQVVLIGSSYGCSVALLAADLEGIQALVLLSPSTDYFGVDVRREAQRFVGPVLALVSRADRGAKAEPLLYDSEGEGQRLLLVYGGRRLHGEGLLSPRLRLKLADSKSTRQEGAKHRFHDWLESEAGAESASQPLEVVVEFLRDLQRE